MTHTIDNREFALKQCGKCGIEFLVPDIFDKENREAGENKTWYCPNGHPRVYRECEADILRRERDRLKQNAARLEEERNIAKRERDYHAQRANKAEANVTRMKKRSASGTCPCCQRSFANMASHMKTQHPEFIAETGAKVVPMKRA